MARIHKTMRGKQVNMETLRIKHEKSIALGNMNVNAGGDQLGPGGVVIKDRNERIREESKLHTMVPGKSPVVKNKQDMIKKTAAQEAADLEVEGAEKLLADAEVKTDPDAPKGGLAASLVPDAPKKKKTTTKKAAE